MVEAYIHHSLSWRQDKIYRNGSQCFAHPAGRPEEILLASYKALELSYLKFFKMDMLSRLGVLAMEWLCPDIDHSRPFDTGIICSTHHGSLVVDKAFDHSRESFASPALFVYTLPNIALGEICIRNKIKGPQICLIEEKTNAGLLCDNALNILKKKRARNCITGHIDATEESLFVDLAWISDASDDKADIPLTAENLARMFEQR